MMEALADELPGARVLDLFAGTGALGLEALSRGAVSADLVENGAAALHALKANVAKLRARGVTRVFVKDALQFVAALDEDAYDVAFVDPPYSSSLAERVVLGWKRAPFAGVLCVEHAEGAALPAGGRTHRLADAAFTVYRRPKGRAG